MLTEVLLNRPQFSAYQSPVGGEERERKGVSDSSEASGTSLFPEESYKLDISVPSSFEDGSEEEASGSEDSGESSEEGNQNQESIENSQSSDSSQVAEGEESASGQELSEEEEKEVEDLEKRDREVRTHEQAHLAAAGSYARGGVNLEYTTGPDQKQYATSGHVNIDTGKAATPEETIQKAGIVRKAALAPKDPSPQDRQVAQEAAAMEIEARAELREEQSKAGDIEKQDSKSEPSASQENSKAEKEGSSFTQKQQDEPEGDNPDIVGGETGGSQSQLKKAAQAYSQYSSPGAGSGFGGGIDLAA